MIKFFRRIRQKLLSENKFSKYLIYAIGEIVLVMIGILLALQVNNWNENRKTQNTINEYYGQLLEDLKKDSSFSKITIEEFKNNQQAFQKYYELYNKDNLELEEVYASINSLIVATKPLSFNSSTIETLQNSGDIKLIPTTIRNKLIDLRRNQLNTIKRAEGLENGKYNIIQRTSLMTGSDDLQKKLERHPELKKRLGKDLKLEELILSIEGGHNWKNIMEKEIIARLQQMEIDINEITNLIKEEIKE
ncbi:DUF6090 family protein [Croceivirga thetidis]|uniref:Uncharacterized protein n=1 Tax=Croceivirga thetidis TaxID=2721623 RepID=A0ABX1GKI3_9FLAO|nr:DUF6090 family protein [Croceivirga thetidis]NKI30422.1 hypothetical protein [Croceivirga thetidis]